MIKKKRLSIIGIREFPVKACDGLETFAQALAQHLLRQGWQVAVHCAVKDEGQRIQVSMWQGIEQVNIPDKQPNSAGFNYFWQSARFAQKQGWPILALGTGMGAFSTALALSRLPITYYPNPSACAVEQWGATFFNQLPMRFADCLIADTPQAQQQLSAHFSPYRLRLQTASCDAVQEADLRPIERLGLEKYRYALLISDLSAQSSTYDCITAFSAKNRGLTLLVAGELNSADTYHNKLLAAAGHEVQFVNAPMDKTESESLRFYARFALMALPEAKDNFALIQSLAAGTPIIAPDNATNRWLLAESALFYHDEGSCESALEHLLSHREQLNEMQERAWQYHEAQFELGKSLQGFEAILLQGLR